MKKILALILSVVMLAASLVSCGGGAAEGDLARVKAADKLVVGVTVYPPMDYIDEESGEWVGFDAELAQMFAEYLDVNCQIVIIKWKNNASNKSYY